MSIRGVKNNFLKNFTRRVIAISVNSFFQLPTFLFMDRKYACLFPVVRKYTCMQARFIN